MKRAELADAFDWDGSLLNLWSFGTDAAAWLRAIHALDRAFPCAFLIGGEPAPLPDLAEIELLATGKEYTAEFHADTPCLGGEGALQVVFFLNFGLDPMEATLHPLDVPDEAAFSRLTHLLGVLAEATGQDVFLCAESGEFESHLVYAVYRSAFGWAVA
ncbi:hypothetical protein [Deinococcus sp. QL22]|uniref:hypothetical protein n=1 Tax=Deinococcus sp. QL22 TaxID=2939437 RepID=UPI0020170551|nr:hypothetical protein [Deinococcus sp. QL22]UQN05592.1 hypothetical protein M1R55_12010 [Deinococcus sp. QL22]